MALDFQNCRANRCFRFLGPFQVLIRSAAASCTSVMVALSLYGASCTVIGASCSLYFCLGRTLIHTGRYQSKLNVYTGAAAVTMAYNRQAFATDYRGSLLQREEEDERVGLVSHAVTEDRPCHVVCRNLTKGQ